MPAFQKGPSYKFKISLFRQTKLRCICQTLDSVMKRSGACKTSSGDLNKFKAMKHIKKFSHNKSHPIASGGFARRNEKPEQQSCQKKALLFTESLRWRRQRRHNRGGPLWCTRFRRVFRSRKWAREIGQKPGEDVVWQRFSQTRQDTVVGVFPMESSN